ncbi:type VII secretion target [Mycolicibacterium fortuitum]|uniref:type VII secretion target n=1 Tax=Mycolicibacterium fortuitum TaxID=1766 RepID=UPI000ABA3926|nr:type VII secretion target [Mycolicibacterium fortuitum]
MGETLRVNPESLRSAARSQHEVGNFVSGMGVGQSMTNAGTGVSGLLSEDACRFASSTIETALGAVHQDLTKHSNSLSTAADHYLRMDEEFGRRLRRFLQ